MRPQRDNSSGQRSVGRKKNLFYTVLSFVLGFEPVERGGSGGGRGGRGAGSKVPGAAGAGASIKRERRDDAETKKILEDLLRDDVSVTITACM